MRRKGFCGKIGWLGELIGVHGRSIGKYEIDQSFPTRKTLQKLADLFGVSIEYFLVEDENTLSSIPIRDKELLQYFLAVDRMNDADKGVVKSVIEGLMAKEKERGKK